MTEKDLRRRFALPRAPEALRERVLQHARESAARSVPPSRIDRIWFSPGWRLAWVAALAVLVALELWAVGSPQRGPGQPAAREADAVAAALGLPPAPYLGDRVVTSGETSLLSTEELP